MSRKFSELTEDWPQERKERVAKKVSEMKGEMALNELRQALEISQAELAERLNIKQPAVSRLENREDMYVGHLREVVEAMGGHLKLTAQFEDLEIRVELNPQA
ncbi:XRE family transcriptional regulator [Acaryochloris sp. IP29b_bin.148]|uniref:XRE family transcriptional regulator n=1 Tax=Acaryochloris sp. IP29b_bin.148 TaxID=2969218 RepID=UPI002602918B|nr:XRE family transcriptional regulator [Acaryochloris sp. IP29b_bin.148]